jgi:hypothetical protein
MMNDNDTVALRPSFNSIDAAWRSFACDMPEMDSPALLAAFVAGASSALSIVYRNGIENLSRELTQIQEELEHG